MRVSGCLETDLILSPVVIPYLIKALIYRFQFPISKISIWGNKLLLSPLAFWENGRMNFHIGEPLNVSALSGRSSSTFVTCSDEDFHSDGASIPWNVNSLPNMSGRGEEEPMNVSRESTSESEEEVEDNEVDNDDGSTRDLIKEVLRLQRKADRKNDRYRKEQRESRRVIKRIDDQVTKVENRVTAVEESVVAVNVRVDGVQGELATMRDEFFERLQSVELNLKSEIANRPTTSGTFKNYAKGPRGMTNHAEGEFYALVNQALSKRHVFVMGHVNDDHGNPTPTKMSAKEILQKYFATVDYELLTTNTNSVSQVRRFRVHPAHIAVTKQMARDINSEIRSIGWWIQQETPNELRRMNGVAVKFFVEAKKVEPALRKYNFDVECGYITINGSEMVPVFMIPEDTQKWSQLATLLVDIVKESTNLPWLERIANPPKMNYELLKKWGAIVGYKPTRGLFDSMVGDGATASPRSASDTSSESRLLPLDSGGSSDNAPVGAPASGAFSEQRLHQVNVGSNGDKNPGESNRKGK